MTGALTSVWPPLASVIAIAIAAAAILLAGVRLAALADRIADRTGIGEAITGAVFLGGSTSLSGVVTSLAAAADGYPELAVANALGGITVQFAFLALADLTYRGTNLEHASADVGNLVYGAVLVALLTLPLLAALSPEVTLGGVHPSSAVILLAYAGGLRVVRRSHAEKMWRPRATRATREDVPQGEGGDGAGTGALWLRFAGAAAVTAAAGWAVSRAGISFVVHVGFSETIVGALLTAVTTSLPELVTTLAAVRRGALVLAVGGIVGGNSFDILFLPLSDLAYREGSLYHALSGRVLFQVGVAILMTSLLLLGLLARERHGPWNIGFESVALLLVYVASLALLVG